MKYLKYPTSDAINQPDLTEDDIYELLGLTDNQSGARISYYPFDSDTPKEDKSELRIFIKSISPNPNSVLADIQIVFQVICGNRIWNMDYGKQRPLEIISEVLKTINGKSINTIGNLLFNSPIRIQYYGKDFCGYEFSPSTKVG